jgi:hypothetical protein
LGAVQLAGGTRKAAFRGNGEKHAQFCQFQDGLL